MAGNAELGLFRTTETKFLPRDNRGRFVSMRRSGARRVIVERARQMRDQLGLPSLPVLDAGQKDAA